MSIFEYIYYLILSLIAKMPSKVKTSDRAILCYHSISKSSWRFAVSPSLFESHIREFLKYYEIVSLQELLTSEKKTDKARLALTFDDGYADNLTAAAPILKKYGLVGTLFMIGSADKANHGELGNTIPLLELSQVKKLKNEYGWEIGYHTATHADLSLISTNELEKEISEGKNSFEKKLGSVLTYFAYPRGYTSPIVLKTVKEAGFRFAFTDTGRQFNKNTPYASDRINCEGKCTPEQMMALMSPAGMSVISFLTRCLQIKQYVISPYFKRRTRVQLYA